MIAVALTLVGILAVLAVAQFLPALGFAWMLRRRQAAPLQDEDCPKAAVILCLRGSDPFLPDCLQGLLNQDYPNYEIRIVIDHREDPAWQVVEDAIERQQATNISVEPLTDRFDTCALKCSSIIQAVSGLDDTFQVVAFLDGDTLPHPTWLRELAAPLLDERIGVSSGNRWYTPVDPTWGSLVRYIWNAAAAVQMYWNRFTWGGSVALRGEIARHADLLASWKTAVSTDCVILDVVRRQGFHAAFAPSLMMTNRESCTLASFFGWVQRQLVTGRLYHRGWKAVLTHGVIMSMVPAAAIVASIVALLNAQWGAATWLMGGLFGYLIAMAMLVLVLESAVAQVVQARGEPANWLTFGSAIKFLLALPLTQVVYAVALAKVTFMRSVTWRGVSYRIDGPRKIHLVEYRPYQSDCPSGDSVASL